MNTELIRINDENPEYCSISLANASRADLKIVYNAVENPTHKLSEFINMELTFSNVSMVQTEIMEKDEDGTPTGEIKTAIKTVLITPDGQGIITTSMGVARSLYSMFKIFGTPDLWEEPMNVVVRQVDIGKNRTFKLEVL